MAYMATSLKSRSLSVDLPDCVVRNINKAIAAKKVYPSLNEPCVVEPVSRLNPTQQTIKSCFSLEPENIARTAFEMITDLCEVFLGHEAVIIGDFAQPIDDPIRDADRRWVASLIEPLD